MMAGKRRPAADLTPEQLAERRARDAERQARRRARDTPRDTPRDTAVDNTALPRDNRVTDRVTPRDLPRDIPRDNSSRDSRSEATAPAVTRRERDNKPRDTSRENGARDMPRDTDDEAPRTPDAPAPRWEPRGDDDTDLIHARTARNVARARARDWAAIERCGLCDRNGYVVVETGANNGGIPTVAFCSHMTTLEATAHDRADLD